MNALCVCVCTRSQNSGCIVMVKVVDYTITRGIPIISQSGSACTRVGESLVVGGGEIFQRFTEESLVFSS